MDGNKIFPSGPFMGGGGRGVKRIIVGKYGPSDNCLWFVIKCFGIVFFKILTDVRSPKTLKNPKNINLCLIA